MSSICSVSFPDPKDVVDLSFEDRVVVHHYRPRMNAKKKNVTLAFKIDTNRGSTRRVVKFGFAKQNPRDTFVKKVGTRIAVARLEAWDGNYVEVNLEEPNSKIYQQVIASLEKVVRDPWTRDLVWRAGGGTSNENDTGDLFDYVPHGRFLDPEDDF